MVDTISISRIFYYLTLAFCGWMFFRYWDIQKKKEQEKELSTDGILTTKPLRFVQEKAKE